jgi:hypothetical protein
VRQHIVHGEAQARKVAALILALNPAKAWKVEIAQYQTRRTISQNKLYWSIIHALASETGHDPDELHTYLKGKFLPKRIVNIAGEDEEVLGSTALLDKPAFSEYVERVAAWAACEFGIQV